MMSKCLLLAAAAAAALCSDVQAFQPLPQNKRVPALKMSYLDSLNDGTPARPAPASSYAPAASAPASASGKSCVLDDSKGYGYNTEVAALEARAPPADTSAGDFRGENSKGYDYSSEHAKLNFYNRYATDSHLY
mmetsp:Transcript_14644/g.31756  ORF Transcript_14644/g.31756 Transcript_14644/m.31756 type:complete len:134 (-) Transcript_14644:306-707(-)